MKIKHIGLAVTVLAAFALLMPVIPVQTQQVQGRIVVATGVQGTGSSTNNDIPTMAGAAGNALQDPASCTLTSSVMQCPSALEMRWSTDAGISRKAAGVLSVDNGTQGNGTGFIKTGQTLQVITTNFTTTSTTLATAGVISGLNFTGPVNVATNWSFHCDLIYSQATAAASDLFGITTAGTAPTNLQVAGEVYTSNTGTQTDNNAQINTATSTTVVTATPGAAGAIGTNADMFVFRIWGTAELPSNATPSQIGIAVATGAGADALTIYRGSACWWY